MKFTAFVPNERWSPLKKVAGVPRDEGTEKHVFARAFDKRHLSPESLETPKEVRDLHLQAKLSARRCRKQPKLNVLDLFCRKPAKERRFGRRFGRNQDATRGCV